MASIRVSVAGGTIDPALVARAVAAIRSGKNVILPTETVYGLAGDPKDPGTQARLSAWKGRRDSQPLTHHLATKAGFAELCEPPNPRVARLIARYWPGPLTLIAKGKDGGKLGVRVPAQKFTQAVIAGCGGDLFLTSVNRTGEEPLIDPDAILRVFGAQVDLICDAGTSKLKIASTVVDVTGAEFTVLREGILSREEVLGTAARTILFVCSGNTCRSPLAEGLAKAMAKQRLGIAEDHLLARGIRFVSAGTATLAGMPASEHAILAAREVGVDLLEHRSRPLTRELGRQAALVLCLTHGHRQRVLDLDPSLHEKTWLLDPGGEDVHDPFGADVATYRATRDEIQGLLDARWGELTKLFAS